MKYYLPLMMGTSRAAAANFQPLVPQILRTASVTPDVVKPKGVMGACSKNIYLIDCNFYAFFRRSSVSGVIPPSLVGPSRSSCNPEYRTKPVKQANLC